MNASLRTNSLALFLIIFLAWSLGGCVKDYLVFATGTKFGIDISQQADQPPYVLLGYKRAEFVSIPAPKGNATEDIDTYSVLANFCVKTDPVLIPGLQQGDSLQIRSVFSTGMAAQEASTNKNMQIFYARHVLSDPSLRSKGGDQSNKTDKDCF